MQATATQGQLAALGVRQHQEGPSALTGAQALSSPTCCAVTWPECPNHASLLCCPLLYVLAARRLQSTSVLSVSHYHG